ncbi:hypothetical protein FB446DRAFT_795422 [Lentinula raphanica]|nr:hypothetical protein FB446DRAFT_795422 [Lentinula raphanica]
MATFSPAEVSLERLFHELVQLMIRRRDVRGGMEVRRVTLNEVKVLEYFVHVGWTEHDMDKIERVRLEWQKTQDYENAIEIMRKRKKLKKAIRTMPGTAYVPFEFFQNTKATWVGPYAANWALKLVEASPAIELMWNDPFALNEPINYALLTEPLPDTDRKRCFTPTMRRNQFFARRPLDTRTRKDFTVRFLYEEEDLVKMGDEEWPVLIYHVVFRRDVNFTLAQLEYQSHLSSSCQGKGNEPDSTRYSFDWDWNIVEHKVHHRFYQHWICREKALWVVRERGSGKYVRGRRNAVEEEVFRLWMNRTEDVHPAWQGSLEDFERVVDLETDEEWQIDYAERVRHAFEYWPSFIEGT